MKTILTSLLIIAGFQAFAQSTSHSEYKGIELQINNSLNYINVERRMSTELIDLDGNPFTYSRNRDYDEAGIGADIEFGYRFNKRWSAGIFAGVSIQYEGFNYFLPSFGGSADVGTYGTYHFTDRFDLNAQLGLRVPPIGRGTYSFGLSPEFALGQQKRVSLRVAAEVFYAKRNARYYFEEVRYDYELQSATQKIHEGTTPETTYGWMAEIGVSYKIGK